MASALEFYDFNSSLKQDENNYIFKDKQFQYFNRDCFVNESFLLQTSIVYIISK